MNRSLVYMKSPLGLIKLEGLGNVLTKVFFMEEMDESEQNAAFLQAAVGQLQEYFDGSRTEFELSIHPDGTHFQRNVWDEIARIPFGKTRSYEEVAKKLGDIKVIRAAASANGRNPLSIIVPCHRVIGKDGSLTGYSGGLWRKKWLLEFEQRERQPKLL